MLAADQLLEEGIEVLLGIFYPHRPRRRDLDLVRPQRDEALQVRQGVDLSVFRLQALLDAELEGVDAVPVVPFFPEEPAEAFVAAGRPRLQEELLRAKEEDADVRRLQARKIGA